ncbi:MAG: glycosyltransferase, partial [Planctomycetota bacterium]
MKILFLQKRFLFPTDTGGKIRTLNIVRHLAQWHDVVYLCNERPEDQGYRKEMEALGVDLRTVPWDETPRYTPRFYMELVANLFSRYPFNVNKDYDVTIKQRLQEIVRSEQIDLVICDFVQMARNVTGIDSVPKLLFEHNVEAKIFERHSRTDKGFLRRCYMYLQWKKMFAFEKAAGATFDRVVAVSPQDRDTYQTDYGWNHVDVIDTSVDTNTFQNQPGGTVAGRLVFVGSMDWLPNIDAMTWFVNE